MRKIIGTFMRSIDAVVWRRKTYDQVRGFMGGRTGGRETVDFAESQIPLRLKSSKKFSDGVVRLHYEVVGHGRRLGAKAAGKRSGRARTKASSRAHRRGTRR